MLIPKIVDFSKMEHYRPIVFANFKFKIINKVIGNKLTYIMPNIISPRKISFIQGRYISDCIYLTLEGIDMLHNRNFN